MLLGCNGLHPMHGPMLSQTKMKENLVTRYDSNTRVVMHTVYSLPAGTGFEYGNDLDAQQWCHESVLTLQTLAVAVILS